jgi:gamma-glutamyl-gamma-aminobutyrate hydrolase PuuD
MFLRKILTNLADKVLIAADDFVDDKDLHEETTHFQILSNPNEQKATKPTIVALYDEGNGSVNADLAIQHFNDKNIEVVPVSSQEGLSHPIFNENKFNGIYLPGGSDVPINNPEDPRKKFEGQLIKIAEQKDIPLIGICRGEQTIGHHEGLKVGDLENYDHHYHHFDKVYDETQDPNFNNKVTVLKGSALYDALHRKLGSDGDTIEYPVTCLHHQHIINEPDDEKLKVTGRSTYDHSIETIEKKTGEYSTIGFQHHPEVIISACKTARQEQINEINEEAKEAALNANYLDPEYTLFSHLKSIAKLSQAHKKSRGEIAAKAELGLFTNQVKKHSQVSEQRELKKRFGE